MKDVSKQTLHDLITFIYNGAVDVEQHDFDDFLRTTKALEIKGLADSSVFEPQPSKPTLATTPTYNGTQYQSSHTFRFPNPANSAQSSYFQYPANGFQQQTDFEYNDAYAMDDHENENDEHFDEYSYGQDMANEEVSMDQISDVQNEHWNAGETLTESSKPKVKRIKRDYSELIHFSIVFLN